MVMLDYEYYNEELIKGGGGVKAWPIGLRHKSHHGYNSSYRRGFESYHRNNIFSTSFQFHQCSV